MQDRQKLTYTICNGLILIVFVFFNWITISYIDISGSGLSIPFKILGMLAEENYIAQAFVEFYGEFFVYMLTWLIIPITTIIVLLILFVKKDTKLYFTSSKVSFMVNIISVVILFFFGQMLSKSLKEEFGMFGSFTSSLVSFGSGPYLILLISIVGLVAPLLLYKLNTGQGMQEKVASVVGKVASTTEKLSQAIPISIVPKSSKPLIMLENINESYSITSIPCILGSSPSLSNCQINKSTIDSEHCTIATIEDQVVIRDMKSTRGTYVNGERLTANRYSPLLSGSILQLGNEEYRVTLFSENMKTEQKHLSSDREKEAKDRYDKQIQDNRYKTSQNDENTLFIGDHDNENTIYSSQASTNSSEMICLKWQDVDSMKTDQISISKTPFCIGRSTDTNYRIDNPKVSRKHCSITILSGQFYIEDLGSSNGTYLNGDKIAPYQKIAIQDGDTLKIGGREHYVRDRSTVKMNGR